MNLDSRVNLISSIKLSAEALSAEPIRFSQEVGTCIGRVHSICLIGGISFFREKAKAKAMRAKYNIVTA